IREAVGGGRDEPRDAARAHHAEIRGQQLRSGGKGEQHETAWPESSGDEGSSDLACRPPERAEREETLPAITVENHETRVIGEAGGERGDRVGEGLDAVEERARNGTRGQ